MRFARTLAVFVALGTVAFAVGDLASDPNPAGALAIVGLIAVFAFLLSVLFRGRRTRPEPAPKPQAEAEPDAPRRRRPRQTVWAGWDASEADRARERRRNRRE